MKWSVEKAATTIYIYVCELIIEYFNSPLRRGLQDYTSPVQWSTMFYLFSSFFLLFYFYYFFFTTSLLNVKLFRSTKTPVLHWFQFFLLLLFNLTIAEIIVLREVGGNFFSFAIKIVSFLRFCRVSICCFQIPFFQKYNITSRRFVA